MCEFNLERVNLSNKYEKNELEIFLSNFNLILDMDVTYSVVYRVNGEIKATASIAGNILKCFALSEEYRGTRILGELANNLMDRLFHQGIYHSFIFTRPDKIRSFSALGYKLIYKANEVALLENGIYDIKISLNKFKADNNMDTNGEKVAILMHKNGVTQKDRQCIEHIFNENKEILLFSTEAMDSNEITLKGNFKIVPNNEYLFSYDLFPKYFIKDEEIRVRAFKELILGIFNEYFSYSFNVKKIYVCEGI